MEPDRKGTHRTTPHQTTGDYHQNTPPTIVVTLPPKILAVVNPGFLYPLHVLTFTSCDTSIIAYEYVLGACQAA
jgi:hypothetical protein